MQIQYLVGLAHVGCPPWGLPSPLETPKWLHLELCAQHPLQQFGGWERDDFRECLLTILKYFINFLVLAEIWALTFALTFFANVDFKGS